MTTVQPAPKETISENETIIEIKNLHKWYGEHHVLQDVNLTVKKGERIVICGPSGSGKSTLIRCINRLEEHQRGHIIVDGIELTDDIKMFMKYPTLSSLDGFDEKDETESTLKMMQTCVDEIHFGDDVYRRVDMSDKELSEFFDDMTTDMFSRVQEFFTTMPKLRHILDIKNPKTKKKSEYMLEGLADFFI